MRFFMLSDLHLGQDTVLENAKEQMKDLCGRIRADIDPDETILFIIMGDIVNKSDVRAFDIAKECLDCICDNLTGMKVKFEFVPGNHDLPNGNIYPFDKFITQYNSNCCFRKKGAYSVVYEDVNFIFADSNMLRDHKLPGKLDLEAIQGEIKPMRNLLFCHHGFEQSYEGDHDTVYNARTVLNKLQDMKIDFVFHGHTHRSEASLTKNGIVEIGCGTIYGDTSWMDGIQNQFSVGYIRDKKIIAVDRFVISKDGGGVYPRETIYPRQTIFADPWSIGKIQYNPLTSYIKRRVISHAKVINGEGLFSLSKEKGFFLHEVLNKEQKILFLSDAGYGKSVEMENLAYELDQENYFPVLFKLRYYNGGKIEEIFPMSYRELSPKLRVLLLDGYDELPSDYKRKFENELKLYLGENSDMRIIISSRSNFCRNEITEESKTFPGFKIFDLCKMSQENIKTYIEERGINVKSFYEAAKEAKVDKLFENPFYLTQLSELFLKNGSLPKKVELMDKLIEASFTVDDDKFSGDLEAQYNELMSLLRKVAFAMQLMQQSKLNDRTEYQALFYAEHRELLMHSGLFNKEGEWWNFIHNNFREYLAARYLSELSQEEIISYIYNGENINPSWVNTLGFLTGISLDWDLNGWIAKNVPTALVKFDAEQVNQDTRYKVLKDIFSYYEKRHLWFYDELCDEEQLAAFAHSASAITFLLDKIANPVHIVSQYTAISILRFFPTLYGRKKEVLECLLDCCRNYPRTRSDVCRLAIFAIHQLDLQCHDVTEELMSLFGENDNDFIRLGMYEYILETGQQNEYVNYFLQGIKYITYALNDDENRIGNEAFLLVEGLKSMSSAKSVSTTIEWMSKESVDFHDANEIYGLLVNKASDLFVAGERTLYDVIYHSCVKNLTDYETNRVRSCVDFFEKTNTLEKTILSLAENFSGEEHNLMDIIHLKPETLQIIVKAYREEKFSKHDAFEEIVTRYVGDEHLYNECKTILANRGGINLPEYAPRMNYEKIRQEAYQEYFNAIFSENQIKAMLQALMEVMENKDVVVSDILDIKVNLPLYSPLRHLRTALYHSGRSNVLVKDFFEKMVFDEFTVVECEKIIGNSKNIKVNKEQEQRIKDLVFTYLTGERIKNEVWHSSEGMRCTRFVLALARIAILLDIDLPEDSMLELVNIPAPYFSEGKNSGKYKYLLKYISVDKVKFRITENLNTGSVDKFLIEDHIDLCRENKWEEATDYALRLCQASESDRWLQCHAFDYLLNMYGASYIKELILPYASGEFLLEIVEKCKDSIQNEVFCEVLEKEYEKEPSYGVMERLIAFGSEKGIEDYVETVVAESKTPEKQAHSKTATTAIRFITNPKYLPYLERLLGVVLLPEYVEDEFWGLRGSLREAFVNCSRVDFESTVAVINRRLTETELDEHNIRYCNYIIEEMKASKRKYSDSPKTIQQVKRILGN